MLKRRTFTEGYHFRRPGWRFCSLAPCSDGEAHLFVHPKVALLFLAISPVGVSVVFQEVLPQALSFNIRGNSERMAVVMSLPISASI